MYILVLLRGIDRDRHKYIGTYEEKRTNATAERWRRHTYEFTQGDRTEAATRATYNVGPVIF
jgi:hypothetical protein